jgi:hypothetical protein
MQCHDEIKIMNQRVRGLIALFSRYNTSKKILSKKNTLSVGHVFVLRHSELDI